MPPHGSVSERSGGQERDVVRDWRGWVRGWWRALVAEALGTALLVGFGCAALRPLPPDGHAPPLTHPALAFGAAVVWLVTALGPVSGALLNPALTLSAVLRRRLPLSAAFGYVVAQCLGAVLGLALLLPFSDSLDYASTTMPPAGALGAVGVEALLTGALALLVCALWAAHDDACPDAAAPLKLGFTIAGLVYSGGPLSHASLNPARTLAPAILTGDWRDHWVYWVGPLLGAAGATLLHAALAPRPRTARIPAPAHEEVPLQDKGDP